MGFESMTHQPESFSGIEFAAILERRTAIDQSAIVTVLRFKHIKQKINKKNFKKKIICIYI